jgi:integrase/recombinase XerC
MPRRFARPQRPRRAMTKQEQRALLRVTADHRKGLRDHVLYSMALATGLRQFELLALNMGDVFKPDGTPRGRIVLRVFKTSTDDPAPQEVVIPEMVRIKLKALKREKKTLEHGMGVNAPLFVSRHGERLSAPRARSAFKTWQRRAGFDRDFTFHELRHTACTNLYSATKNLLLVQRFARHSSPETTAIYAHVSDDDLESAVDNLLC